MIHLKRGKTELAYSGTIWMMTLEIARLCGWTPKGTLRLIKKTADASLEDLQHLLAWQTEYVCQDGQTVTAKDAAELAEGLARATTDGPSLLDHWNNGDLEPPAKMRTPSTGFVWFNSGEGKTHLQKLAHFCRAGEFQIS